MNHSIRIFAVAGCVLLGMAGCAQPNLTHQAMAFNKTVQQHRLEQLFLNVLRAGDNEPMTMTAIGSLQMINEKSAGGGVDFKAGPLSMGPYGVRLGGDISSRPTMNLTILDNDEKFVAGFTQPIGQEKIGFIVQQGRDVELLAHLLVEKIHMPLKDLAPAERDAADRAAARHHASGFVTLPNDPRSAMYPVFLSVLERRLPNDVIITDQGFAIRDSQAEIIIRSPERILRFLGEVASLQMPPREAASFPIPTVAGKPLFLVRTDVGGGAAVSVVHRGRLHVIPNRPESHSLACLSFVQDLINIQSKQVPTAPSTIQLIGS